MHPIIDFIVTLPGALFTALYLGLVSLANVIMPQRKSLKNDVALVTGGGSGIGRLVAHRLAKKGATVVLWDLNLAGCEQVVKEIEEDGGKAYGTFLAHISRLFSRRALTAALRVQPTSAT